jgi:hypothetical protein
MAVLFSEIPWGPVLILLPLVGGIACFLFPASTVNDRPNGATHDRSNGATFRW